MNKISKKLTNVIYISGKSAKIEEFLKGVKEKKIKIISVRIPKQVEKDELTKFIDKKWKVAKMDLDNKVMLARPSSTQAIIVFSDDNLEHTLLNNAQNLNLEIKYKYLLDDDIVSYIVTEEKRGGQLKLNDFVQVVLTDTYSIALQLV